MKTRKINSFILTFILLNVVVSAQQVVSHRNNVVPVSDPANNCGYGINAFNNTGNGTDNTALGYKALTSNFKGNNNTAVGVEAMTTNDNGSDNTAIGANSMHNNCAGGLIGERNTALGHTSLYNNDDGDENTAVGKSALYSNTTGSRLTAVGCEALYSNNGTVGAYGEANVAAGYQALYQNFTGVENTAIGSQALYNSPLSKHNTAIGFRSIYNNFSDDNTAIGHSALFSGGANNTSVGYMTLYNNGYYDNTAFGYQALLNNQVLGNTAIGSEASSAGVAGGYNTSCGYRALKACTGMGNIGIGNRAGENFANGSNDNIAIGFKCLQYTNPGNGNTLIGATADMTGNFTNSSALGYGATITTDKTIRLGGSTAQVGGQVMYSSSSDGRFKFNIKADEVKGLDFIMLLKPVTYNFDMKKYEDFIFKNTPDSVRKNRPKEDFSDFNRIIFSGFLAQDIEKAAKETGFDFNGIYKPANENEAYKLSYDAFVVPLVKAIQEQQKTLEEQKTKINKLKTELERQNQIISNSASNPSSPFIAGNDHTNGMISINVSSSADKEYLDVIYSSIKSNTTYSILMYNSDGTQINEYSIPASESEKGSLRIDAVEKGSYILVVILGDKCVGIQNFNLK